MIFRSHAPGLRQNLANFLLALKEARYGPILRRVESSLAAAMITGEKVAERCCKILDTEIREALTGLADSISSGDQLGGGDRESRVGLVS